MSDGGRRKARPATVPASSISTTSPAEEQADFLRAAVDFSLERNSHDTSWRRRARRWPGPIRLSLRRAT